MSRSAGAQGRVAPPRADARYHGDQAVTPGMADFAVNVRADGRPSWLVERLAGQLGELGRYPSETDHRRATSAVATRHGRHPDEVLPLAGGAEGFAVLAHLRPRLAALVAQSFTEPEAVLTAAGVPIRHVVLDPPFGLLGADVPDESKSLAGLALPDVLVLRRLTKTWSLAGLRVGYALGAPDVLRPGWPTLVAAMVEAIR